MSDRTAPLMLDILEIQAEILERVGLNSEARSLATDDRFRKERVWQPLPEEHSEIASDDVGPDELVSRQERLVTLQESLKVLPQEQLEVVRLSYLDGLAHSDIADRLGLPIGTVKSRMRLAYQKLRPLVDKLK